MIPTANPFCRGRYADSSWEMHLTVEIGRVPVRCDDTVNAVRCDNPIPHSNALSNARRWLVPACSISTMGLVSGPFARVYETPSELQKSAWHDPESRLRRASCRAEPSATACSSCRDEEHLYPSVSPQGQCNYGPAPCSVENR